MNPAGFLGTLAIVLQLGNQDRPIWLSSYPLSYHNHLSYPYHSHCPCATLEIVTSCYILCTMICWCFTLAFSSIHHLLWCSLFRLYDCSLDQIVGPGKNHYFLSHQLEHNVPPVWKHNVPHIWKHNVPHVWKHNVPHVWEHNVPHVWKHKDPMY